MSHVATRLPRPAGAAAQAAGPPAVLDLRTSVHRKLLNRLNLEALAQARSRRAEAEIRTLLGELVAEERSRSA
jgi:hypothetical protein